MLGTSCRTFACATEGNVLKNDHAEGVTTTAMQVRAKNIIDVVFQAVVLTIYHTVEATSYNIKAKFGVSIS